MHKLIKHLFLTSILFLLLPITVLAYTVNDSILINNIQATPENPYIIEGYEISNPNGTCIEITNSKNIIIRNNYLHNCGTDEEFQRKTDHYQEGYATLIGDSSNIFFENNILDRNFRGFMAYNTPYLRATNNKITNTLQYSPLWCETCSYSEFSFNYLSDNGNPMHFWVPGDRSIGIWIKKSDNVEIHNNTIIRSTSDGIAVTGQIYASSFTVEADPNIPHPQADWTSNSNNINIYNNIILDNMEQGIWLVNARNIDVYGNTIRTGCFTYGSPISTEFNVGNSNFYNNKFLGCLVSVVGGAYSFNINVYDNSYYYYDDAWKHFVIFEDKIGDVVALASRQGANYKESVNNHERNNERIFIGGILAEEMEDKLRYANNHRTYDSQGWMSCLSGDGWLDENCVEREMSVGIRGVAPNLLLYSSLMDDFDNFIIEDPLVIDEEEEFSEVSEASEVAVEEILVVDKKFETKEINKLDKNTETDQFLAFDEKDDFKKIDESKLDSVIAEDQSLFVDKKDKPYKAYKVVDDKKNTSFHLFLSAILILIIAIIFLKIKKK